MKQLIAFIFCFQLSVGIAFAQNIPYGDISKIIVAVCDSNHIKPLSEAMANLLPDKNVYLRGEYHGIRSNYISFGSLFKALHEKKSVNYMLYEYNHSWCFGYNLFLKYGDLKILTELEQDSVSDSLTLKRKYAATIALYKYNLGQKVGHKISLIGADIDLDNGPLRPNAERNYKTAIKFFKKYAQYKLPTDIDILFNQILSATDRRILKDLDIRLREVSAMHVSELVHCLGEFYKDYYIIIHSSKYSRGIYREKEMMANLKLAVEAIEFTAPNSNPKFFGSFGASHVQPGRNDSFASILNRSGIFKNQVSYIGSGYYNSLCTYNFNKPVIIQGATIAGLSKHEQTEANNLVKNVAESQNRSLILLSNFNTLPKGQLDFLKLYDAFIIYNGF